MIRALATEPEQLKHKGYQVHQGQEGLLIVDCSTGRREFPINDERSTAGENSRKRPAGVKNELFSVESLITGKRRDEIVV
jgi:hypothetical protein